MLNLCNCPPNNQGQFTAYSNIIIHYPGYKKNGDYRLEIQGGTVPSHSDICKILHNLIVNNRYSFSVLEQLLEDIYENGTLTDYEDRNLKYLQNLIFWVTLATVYKGNIIKINNGLPILRRDTAQTRLRAVFL